MDRKTENDTTNVTDSSSSGTSATASQLPPSANFHLWQPCNMACRFCFAVFEDVRDTVLPRGHLPRDQALRVTTLLARHFDKLTFVGGEPTLCPWLPDLIRCAKVEGATTMIVTNGARITSTYLEALQGSLDWVTVSMDSALPERHATMGRAVRGEALPLDRYFSIADAVRANRMRFKVNTVVNAINSGEEMFDALARLRPERWKLFQVLPVEGQNAGSVDPLLITAEAFQSFVDRHRHLAAYGIEIVAEDNDAMRGSYAMVDPAGRFFDNASGGHRYSRPILDAGVQDAWKEIQFDLVRFVQRGGVYGWGR